MLVVAAASATLATGNLARAAGFAAARFGGEHGNVTETNPTALYFNPGAIGHSEGVHLYLDGTLALRRVSWTHPVAANDVPDPAGAEGANSGKAELSNVFGAPMIGATLRLGDFAFGAAAYVPFGGRARWSPNDDFAGAAEYPLAADGVQRWHSIEGALTYVYGTLGVAYRWRKLSIGASANLVHSSVVSKKAKNPTGQGDPDTEHEGRVELDVSGVQGSFAAGALLELLEQKLWLGASYQAQPGLGPMQLKGTLTVSYDGESAPYPVTFDQALPDIVRLGARYRPSPAVELRLFGDVTRLERDEDSMRGIRRPPLRRRRDRRRRGRRRRAPQPTSQVARHFGRARRREPLAQTRAGAVLGRGLRDRRRTRRHAGSRAGRLADRLRRARRALAAVSQLVRGRLVHSPSVPKPRQHR
jgi:hypothetical protein